MKDSIIELIKKCSVDIPRDVENRIKQCWSLEEEKSPAKQCLLTILDNTKRARAEGKPVCQDTGVLLFFAHIPENFNFFSLKNDIFEAVKEATQKSLLRPNCVNTLSGINSGDNTGTAMPVIKVNVWEKDFLKIGLLLKGGGSENVSAQYKLPDVALNAERDLEGVRKVVLKSVQEAQGKGCAPGIIGVGIGGDRELSYTIAKNQLFRSLDDTNYDKELKAFEQRLLSDINSLGIGPMGLGGRTTALGVKIGTAERHPACYFVTVSYLCWAARRYEMAVYEDGKYEYI